jgi:thiamine pyrophosphokinase
MRVVIVASGDVDAADAQHLDAAELVIAADGGTTSLERIGRRPDLVVGDLDSADESLVSRLAGEGTRVERHPEAKDASDAELALRAALDAGGTDVVLAGATGGDRFDHALANVLLLASGWLAGRSVRMVHGGTTVRVVRSGERLELGGAHGDIVTLLPIAGDAEGVTTRGLRWQLEGARLRLGSTLGLSNEVTDDPASVSVAAGALLVVEARRAPETQVGA